MLIWPPTSREAFRSGHRMIVSMGLGVVAQQGNERAQALAAEMRSSLGESGIDVKLDRVTADALGRSGEPVSAFEDCEIVASIGGDGTFLFVARSVGETPIVGVNLGEVGFLNAVAPSEATKVVGAAYKDARAGTLETQTLPRVVASGTDWSIGPALNEIILHAPQRGVGEPLSITIEVDGDQYSSDLVDGIMVSTPTGSTAYNLSEGGPLLTPEVSGLVITEMSGRDSMPPLVVPLEAVVEIDVEGPDHWIAICDGRSRKQVETPDSVSVQRGGPSVRVAGPPVAFFDALEKLS